ncbi:DUF222 domain-containing protein [Amycolatopsis nigrescens]|uniref:DUF222 domain-containing protein n=1 Tax=Amycolatopsis nigrescens TaxID=381445 RepID=UPI0009FD4A6D|nr:DUF222 domain-containing protein [Amycolatopsis nigrescens]
MDRNRATELLKEIQVLEGQKCRVEAAQLKLIAELNEVEDRSRGVPAELALGLSITENAAMKRIALAEALAARLPKTLTAMESGMIDSYKATKIFEATTVLTEQRARDVDAIMADRLADKNPPGLRRAVNRVIAQIDPDGYAARVRKRRIGRKLELVHRGEGTSSLVIDVPVEVGAAMYVRADRDARALKTKDEPRTLDQLRADVIADRCLRETGTLHNPRADVHLYVDLTTLAGLNDDPAEVAGYGPIPAWLAKEIAFARHSTWRRVVTDPVTGLPVDVGRNCYHPPPDLSRFIRVRDRECREPGCHRLAQADEIDRNGPWAHGGGTNELSLAGYCKRHHELKDLPYWTHTIDDAGVLTITTPAGATYTSPPWS